MNTSTAIRCRGLAKSYGKGDAQVQALQGVDIDIPFGELTMLVGPSGCGKTTLISIVAGILDQDEGECTVLGQDLHAMAPDERTRFRGKSIGFVFQAFNLIPSLTVTENAAVPLLINGTPRKEAMSRARAAVEAVGLGGRADALATQLSGGQKQRVAIARALVHEPKLIVCDEPTSNLDHTSGQQAMELLRHVVRSQDRALVVVTHDPRILEFADRIAQMDDGRIVSVTKTSHAESTS